MATQLDQTLAALADPTRRAILRRLSQGEARVTEVARPFAMSLNSVSKHIRMLERARLVRRRRECLRCERRFTTYEYIEERPLQVLKRDGEREPYDRRKLLTSIRTATAKRPVSPTEIDRIVEDIERELDRRESGEVESQELGQMVMDRLKSRDHIA